jgi:hypothetical protein
MRARTKWAAVAALVVLLASVSALVTTAFGPPRSRAVPPGPQRVAADSVVALPLRGEAGPAPPVAALPVRLAQWGYGPPPARVTLGTVGLTDVLTSVFALNSDGTWVGLPNNQGGQSFICYSMLPPVNYSFGRWRYDPRIGALNFSGPDRTPLATLNGFNLGAPFPQGGPVSGWHCGPSPNWSFIPR